MILFEANLFIIIFYNVVVFPADPQSYGEN